jgi:hypothetical protein
LIAIYCFYVYVNFRSSLGGLCIVLVLVHFDLQVFCDISLHQFSTGQVIDVCLQKFPSLYSSVTRLLQTPIPLYNLIIVFLCFTFFTIDFFMIIGVTDPVLYIGMPFRMFTLQHDEDHYFVEVQCLILIKLYFFFQLEA